MDSAAEVTEDRNLEMVDPEMYSRIKSYTELPEYSDEERTQRSMIQQEYGISALPAIVKLVEEEKFYPFYALNLIEGITGDNGKIFQAVKSVAMTPRTFMSSDPSAIHNALQMMCIFSSGKPEFNQAVDEVMRKIQHTDRVPNLRDLRRYANTLSLDYEIRHEWTHDLNAAREESFEIYRYGDYRAYSRRWRDEGGLHVLSALDDFDHDPNAMWATSSLDSPGHTKPEPSMVERPHVAVIEDGYGHFGDGKEWHFDSNGVRVQIYKSPEDETFIVDGKKINIAQGDLVANIDFEPAYTDSFRPERMLQVLALGYKGVKDFLDRVYWPIKYPRKERLPYGFKLLTGRTNRRMGEMATRFGFKMTDEGRLGVEGGLGKEDNVTVIATLGDLKRAFNKMDRSGLGKKILERGKREGLVEVPVK